jgi:predicted CXXCH cytochrome family protein
MPRLIGLVTRPAVGFAALMTALAAWAAADWYWAEPRNALETAHYVGRASCVSCHQAEAEAFAGSHHDRAMDVATDETVLGDFNDAEFTHFDERTRFFRDGKKFMVNAEGPDGVYRDYEVKYTFGVHPLQQYMVEFPDGRIQVLRASWDVENKRWFYVAPMDVANERIPAGDPFHWTGFAQNWNTMCAECHVTDYHKNYDLATDTYKSTYNENDVSCEACHGPGSLHVKLAESNSLFWDRNVRYGLTNTLKNVSNERQLNSCAPCHSRRSMIHPDYRPGDNFLDHFEPSLLREGLYHADGQIHDEVFEYGSFTQSRMFREGVKCTDCHDPHSAELKYDGNRLCAQCHQPGKYDGPGHHHHTSAAPGAPETQCVTCHMPTTVYMGIDARRDHSIRVPRPDLTVSLGTPNVCNRCHTEPGETAQWAADAIVQWYGSKRPDDPHYATAIHAAREREQGGDDLARRMLRRRETPDIVRATLVELLGAYSTEESSNLRQAALSDENALVRAAAVRAFNDMLAALKFQVESLREAAEIDPRASLQLRQQVSVYADLSRALMPRLSDSVRTVRFAAAMALAPGSQEIESIARDPAFKSTIAEYRSGQGAQSDRAEAHAGLGDLSMNLGDPAAAVDSLRTAIRLQPERTQFRTQLSQMLDRIAGDPQQAEIWKKVGGSEDEIRRLREEEVTLLERDAKLLPGDPAPHDHRGRLLVLLKRDREALEAFREATRLAPDEYEYWLWVALICERLHEWEEGVAALQQMRRLRPDGGEWQGLRQRFLETIRQEEAAKNAAPETPDAAPPPAEAAAPTVEEAAQRDDSPPTTQEPPGTPGRRAEPTVQSDEQAR